MKKILILLMLLFSGVLFSQKGMVSGVLEDEIGPLLGVNILIKGTSVGTESDMEGKYSIKCSVGDVLQFSFMGLETREVVVNPTMFDDYKNDGVTYFPVKLFKSNVYFEAVKKMDSIRNSGNVYVQPVISDNSKVYNLKKSGGFEYKEIKNIKSYKDSLHLTYFSPYYFYEVGYTGSTGLQYFRNKNLPKLQNTYSQGEGVFKEGSLFSYGANIKNLEFNGATNYLYDKKGKLVPRGTGNGINAIPYKNSVLSNSIKNSHYVFFNISHKNQHLRLSFSNQTGKDVFNREQNSSNKITLKFTNNSSHSYNNWNAFVTYRKSNNRQPNINGFHNNVLLNTWATPSSFSNYQGTVSSTNKQRSFNSNFNNPIWLLDFNKNGIESNNFITGFQSKFKLSKNFDFRLDANYIFNSEEQRFELPINTVGFLQGFSSSKKFDKSKFNSSLYLLFDDKDKTLDYDGNIKLSSNIDFTYDDLKYRFNRIVGVQPISFNTPRNVVRLSNKVKVSINDLGNFSFTNNSYYSSIQNNKWFLPSLTANFDVKEILDLRDYRFSNLNLYTVFSLDVNDLPLYYNNLSHNSLLIRPEESMSYTANNDLFISDLVNLEEKQSFEIGVSGSSGYDRRRYGRPWIEYSLAYYHNKTDGSVFPLLQNGKFQLKNVADIQSSGIEFNVKSKFRLSHHRSRINFMYHPEIRFSKNRTKVLRLWDNRSEVAIAGFSTVSKKLIEGQPAGVIVGSTYQRDANNDLVIGSDGFPLVDASPKIIGDPTPDFTIGFSNNFELDRLKFGFTIDYQKGGDIWNGTQNTLNYLGRSQQSATDRNINYDPSNIASKNKFVHYGFSGVAEDAIEDGSYLNVKSVNISYSIFKNEDRKTIRNLVLALYANNLFTLTKSSSYSPFSTLYGNQSARGLNFFNTPTTSEVGLTLKIKL